MQRGIQRLGKYILLLLFLICFGYMLSLQATLSRSGTPVIYYLGENSLSYDMLTSMREDADETAAGTGAAERLSYTAVGTLENQTFSNEVLERSATGTLFLIDGTSANLVSSAGELMADDLSGCVISTEAAWELFGETEVTGGEVIYSGVSCEVRGVFEDTECVVILPAALFRAAGSADSNGENIWSDSTGEMDDGGTNFSFDKLIVVPDEALSDAERSEAIGLFETTNSLNGDSTDCMIYQRLSTVFVMLVPAILMLIVIGRGIAGLVRNRRRPFRLALLCVILSAVFFVFFRFFQISPSIPADLIPNTWSDFDFWKEKLEGFAACIRHLLFQNKSEIELNYYNPLVRLAALTGTGIILLVLTNLKFTADFMLKRRQDEDIRQFSAGQEQQDEDIRQHSVGQEQKDEDIRQHSAGQERQDEDIRQHSAGQEQQDEDIRQYSAGQELQGIEIWQIFRKQNPDDGLKQFYGEEDSRDNCQQIPVGKQKSTWIRPWFVIWGVIGSIIMELIAVFLLHRWGVYLDGKRMLLYLWPYFLLAKYAVAFAAD